MPEQVYSHYRTFVRTYGAGFRCANIRISFSNDVCTALRSHPDLVDATSLDIDTITHAVCLLLGFFLLGIRDRQLPFENQVRGQASVGVGTVVGVPVARNISPVSRRRGCVSRQTYGPSVQVNTCVNPHERTSCSDSRWDFAAIVNSAVQKVVRCEGGRGRMKPDGSSPSNRPRMNLGPCLAWRGSIAMEAPHPETKQRSKAHFTHQDPRFIGHRICAFASNERGDGLCIVPNESVLETVFDRRLLLPADRLGAEAKQLKAKPRTHSCQSLRNHSSIS